MSINDVKPGEIGIFPTMIASGPVIIRETRNDDDILTEVLLVKHGDKPVDQLKWKFPGGKLRLEFSLKQAARQEALEEVGVDVELKQPLCPIALWHQEPESGSEKPQVILLIHYLAEIRDGKNPVAGPDILAMEWFDIDDLPSDCSPNVEPVIEEYKHYAPPF